MKKLMILAAVAATVSTTPALAQRAPAAVVVVVDTSRIYAECTACRAAQAQLQSQATALQSRQQALSGPIRTEAQAIQTAVNALSGRQPDAALTARIQAIQARETAANQELQRLQQGLQSSQANVLRQINARLNPAINQVMTARGANLAVDTDATLARSQSLDVTAAVLAALNSQLPSVSVTPLPANQTPQGR